MVLHVRCYKIPKKETVLPTLLPRENYSWHALLAPVTQGAIFVMQEDCRMSESSQKRCGSLKVQHYIGLFFLKDSNTEFLFHFLIAHKALVNLPVPNA